MAIKDWDGGVISDVSVAPTSGATSASAPASGIWTLSKAADLAELGYWPKDYDYYIAGTQVASTSFTTQGGIAVESGTDEIVYQAGRYFGTNQLVVQRFDKGQFNWQLFYNNDSLSGSLSGSVTGHIFQNGPNVFFGWLDQSQNDGGIIRLTRAGAFSYALIGDSNMGDNKYGVKLLGGDLYYFGSAFGNGTDGYIGRFSGIGGTPYSVSDKLYSDFAASIIDVAMDSSGYLYLAMGVTSNYAAAVKTNTSFGTIFWQNSYKGGAVNTNQFNGVEIDSNDNAVFAGRVTDIAGTYENCSVVQYNSGGTKQWELSAIGPATNYGGALTIDSSDNIYFVVSGKDTAGRADNGFGIVKVNSSGTVQWQRYFYCANGGAPNANFQSGMLKIANGKLFVSFRMTNSASEYFMGHFTYPLDGSLNGVTAVIGAWNLSVDTAAYTISTSAKTSGTSNVSLGNAQTFNYNSRSDSVSSNTPNAIAQGFFE